MSVANQQASTQMRGTAPTWTTIAGGAIVLVLLTAALTWFASGAIAPRTGVDAAASTSGAVSGIANPALVEFRQGEQGASAPTVDLIAPNPALVEFRQGEQGASAPTGGFTPDAGLVEFRHGEQSH
jgi:hypothetical protein